MGEPSRASPGPPSGAPGEPRIGADTDERRRLAGRLVWLEATRRVSRTVRHDLANVFTGISFFVSQLEGEVPRAATSAEDVQAMADVVERGAALLDLLRDLGREPSESEVAPLDPAAVIAGIASVLTAVALPCSLSIGPLDAVVVRASRRGLEEAVLALVVEAREAAGAAGGDLRLSVTPQSAAPEEVDPALGPHAAIVLDAPRALSAPTSDDPLPDEPGFGLAFAAQEAAASGGRLATESDPDGRAAVRLLIPRALSRMRHDEAAVPPPDADGGARA